MHVILDTDDLVRRYMAYDPLFSFYENGVKDIVKEAILRSGSKKNSSWGDFDSELIWGTSLAGRVSRDWERAIDMSLDHSPHLVHDYLQGQNKMDREVIHIVVEQIEEEVDLMLWRLTDAKYYRVSQVDVSSCSGWIGNDLVVDITSLPEECDGPF